MRQKNAEELSTSDINTLFQKKEFLKQKLNHLKGREQLLKIQERKFRTKRLIEVGGLAAKAQIDHLPTNILFGAFLYLQQQLNDPQTLKQWEHAGGKAFNNDKQPKSITAVVIKFNIPPLEEIKALLKASSCKWNKIRKEWEGLLSQDQLKTLSDALREGEGRLTVLEETKVE